MSLDSWKEEFYPVEADDPSIKTNLQAVQHSIRKWEGLGDDNLRKHGVGRGNFGNVFDGDRSFGIDGSTCALCVRHLDTAHECRACPLARARGGVRCDCNRRNEDISPFAAWVESRIDHSPAPMLGWLYRAERSLIKDQLRRIKRVANQG